MVFTGLKRYHRPSPSISDSKIHFVGNVPPIDSSECGISKGCYSLPTGCTYSKDCDVLFTWQDIGDSFYFEMDSVIDPALGTNVWAALGFSQTADMVA